MAAVPAISLVLLLLIALPMDVGCARPPIAQPGRSLPKTLPACFAVYALSRGKGVPAATRGVYRDVLDMLRKAEGEGTVIRLEETRLGLEGERKLCAELQATGTADKLFRRIRTMAEGVDLLRLVDEPCLDP